MADVEMEAFAEVLDWIFVAWASDRHQRGGTNAAAF